MTNNYLQRLALPASWTTATDAAMAESVGRWAEVEVMRRRTELVEDRDALLVPAAASLLDELGLRYLLQPEDDGAVVPAGAATTVTTVLEQVGRADTGIAFGLAGTYALDVAARVHHKPRVRKACLGGARAELGALVLPGFGGSGPAFDGLDAQVVARRRGRSWLLDGTAVRPQFGGADPQLLAVFAAVKDAEPGVLVVPGTADGLSRGPHLRTTGLAFSRSAELALDAVKVTDSMVVCRGAAACSELVAWSRLGCAAAAAGAAQAGYAILDDWADNRVIKGRGQPFKRNALVAAILGEIGGHLLSSRLQLYGLAQLLDEAAGNPDAPPSASRHTAALVVSREVIASSLAVLDRGMELMASAGYATEWNLERYWRDVRTLQCLQGSSTHARTTVARDLFGTEIR